MSDLTTVAKVDQLIEGLRHNDPEVFEEARRFLHKIIDKAPKHILRFILMGIRELHDSCD